MCIYFIFVSSYERDAAIDFLCNKRKNPPFILDGDSCFYVNFPNKGFTLSYLRFLHRISFPHCYRVTFF